MQSNQELILQCLQIEDRGQKFTRLAKYSPLDWGRVLFQAERHGLAPMVAWQIKSLGLEALPPEEVHQVFRNSLRIGTGNNLILFNELGKVLRQFKEEGIPVIVLKGAHLAAIVYGHIGVRSMEDIDLMVPFEHLAKSSDILNGLGYLSETVLSDKADIQSVMQHLPFFCKPNMKPIEVHWTIGNPKSPFQIDLAEVWEGAQEVVIAGVPVFVLSPEDLIVHLCTHAYEHRFSSLRQFLDLYLVMEHHKDAIQWDLVRQKARRWKATKCLFLALYLAQRLMNLPRMAVLENIAPSDFNPELAEALLANNFNRASFNPDFIKLWGNLAAWERICYIWNRIFLSPQMMAWQYEVDPTTPGLYWAYMLRIKDLLKRYWRVSWSNLIHHNALKSSADLEVALVNWIASE